MTLSDYIETVKSLRKTNGNARHSYIPISPEAQPSSRDTIKAYESRMLNRWFRDVGNVLKQGVAEQYLPYSQYAQVLDSFYQRKREFHHREAIEEDIEYAQRILDDIIEVIVEHARELPKYTYRQASTTSTSR